MKKLLSKLMVLLGVFLFLGAGNSYADYWLIGNGSGMPGFVENPLNESAKMEKFKFKDENGKPTLYVENLTKGQYKISQGNGWSNTFGAKEDQFKEIKAGKTNYTWQDPNQQAMEANNDLGPIKITIEGVWNDGKNLQLYFDSYTPSVKGTDAYIRGGFVDNNWNVKEDWKFTYDSNNDEYTFNCVGNYKIPANQEFKIAGSDWNGDINYGLSKENDNIQSIDPSGEKTLSYNVDNFKLNKEFEGKITLKVISSRTTATLTFEPKIETPVDPTPEEESDVLAVYMVGKFYKDYSSWDESDFSKNSIRLIKRSNGTWTASGVTFDQGTNYFKFKINGFDGAQFGPNSNDNVGVNANTPFQAYKETNTGKSYSASNGTYNIIVKFDNDKEPTQATVTLEKEKTLYLYGWCGVAETTNATSGYKMTQTGDNTWKVYNVNFNRNNTSDPAYFRFNLDGEMDFGPNQDGNKQAVKGGAANSAPRNYADGMFSIAQGNYDITFTKLSDQSAQFTITDPSKDYPEYMYIIGHTNSRAWETYNAIQMKQEKPGVYVAEKVNISGVWNAADKYQDGKWDRVIGTDSGKENYISFFREIPQDRLSFGNSSLKFGTSQENEPVNGSPYISKKVSFANDNNFMVNRGVYNIRVSLVEGDMYVEFYNLADESGKYELVYDWHDGEGEFLGYEEGDTHVVKVHGRVQVGVDGEATHDAANGAVFKVWYKAPTTSGKPGMKKITDAETAGYTPATDGVEYKLIGKGIEDVNMIQLNNIGRYIITANLPNSHALYEECTIPEAVMYAKVSDAALDVTAVNKTVSFNHEGVDITGLLNFESNQVDKDDLAFTFTPATSGWATGNTADLLKSNSDLLWQYNSLSVTDVDGAYNPLTNANILSVSAGDKDGDLYEYTVKVKFPCSGVYNVKVEATDNSDVSFSTVNATVTVTPNIELMYGSESAFNINGYGFPSSDNLSIKYPFDENGAHNPANSFAYTPGLYFASSLELTPGWGVRTMALEGEEEAGDYYGAPISMVGLPESGANLVAKVTKNGATSTSTFLISKGTGDDFYVSTGVDTIGAEDGEAEYFNLQGVKVQNPEHGIYVKVQNGKAVKVVL